ncbi:MAG: SCO family protein [Novosphingobium sp.]|nr:MAG: SCO family protein [Novosphingobium sp.]
MNRHAMIKTFRGLTALFLPLALPLALGACSGGGSPQQTAQRPPLEGAAIGGPFTLVDKTGRAVSWSDFDGKYRIIYFGYSFCPDACPVDVQKMMQGFALFEKAQPQLAAQVQPIFVTIDPARDTPEIVGEFAAAFSPRLLGLTGTQAQIDAAAKSFAIYHAKGKETPGGYLMDHSRTAYLMGRKGEAIAMLPVDKAPKDVAAELAKWVK